MADFIEVLPLQTFVGNLTADPKKKKTANDKVYAQFTLAQNDPAYGEDDKGNNRAAFFDFEAYGLEGQHMLESESIGQGTRMVVVARPRTYGATVYDEDGEERMVTKTVYTVQFMGPDLAFATVEVTKAKAKGRRMDDDELSERPSRRRKASDEGEDDERPTRRRKPADEESAADEEAEERPSRRRKAKVEDDEDW